MKTQMQRYMGAIFNSPLFGPFNNFLKFAKKRKQELIGDNFFALNAEMANRPALPIKHICTLIPIGNQAQTSTALLAGINSYNWQGDVASFQGHEVKDMLKFACSHVILGL